MKTITGNEIKLLPELMYDGILEYDGENGFLRDHIFFSKDDIPEEAKKLYIYCDISTKLFITQLPSIQQLIVRHICEKLYDEMRYIDENDRREDGRPTIYYHNYYYTFYDNADIKTEYHREKDKRTGEEIDYIRLIFSIVVKIDDFDQYSITVKAKDGSFENTFKVER